MGRRRSVGGAAGCWDKAETTSALEATSRPLASSGSSKMHKIPGAQEEQDLDSRNCFHLEHNKKQKAKPNQPTVVSLPGLRDFPRACRLGVGGAVPGLSLLLQGFSGFYQRGEPQE